MIFLISQRIYYILKKKQGKHIKIGDIKYDPVKVQIDSNGRNTDK
jgi:hypothetical protein